MSNGQVFGVLKADRHLYRPLPWRLHSTITGTEGQPAIPSHRYPKDRTATRPCSRSPTRKKAQRAHTFYSKAMTASAEFKCYREQTGYALRAPSQSKGRAAELILVGRRFGSWTDQSIRSEVFILGGRREENRSRWSRLGGKKPLPCGRGSGE